MPSKTMSMPRSSKSRRRWKGTLRSPSAATADSARLRRSSLSRKRYSKCVNIRKPKRRRSKSCRSIGAKDRPRRGSEADAIMRKVAEEVVQKGTEPAAIMQKLSRKYGENSKAIDIGLGVLGTVGTGALGAKVVPPEQLGAISTFFSTLPATRDIKDRISNGMLFVKEKLGLQKK
jgi:hypothetical protein